MTLDHKAFLLILPFHIAVKSFQLIIDLLQNLSPNAFQQCKLLKVLKLKFLLRLDDMLHTTLLIHIIKAFTCRRINENITDNNLLKIKFHIQTTF